MAEYVGEFLACIEDGVVKHGYSPESNYTEPFDRLPGSKIVTENPAVTVVVPDVPSPEDTEEPGDSDEVKKAKKDKRRDKFKIKVENEKDKDK